METVKTYIDAACKAHHLNEIKIITTVRKPNGERITLSDILSDENFQRAGGMSPIFNSEIEAWQISAHYNAIPYLHDMWDETPHIELIMNYEQIDALYELNTRYTCQSNNYIDVNVIHWFKLTDLIQNLEDYYHTEEQLIIFKDGPLLNKICQDIKETHFMLGSISDNKCRHFGYEKINCVTFEPQKKLEPVWSELRCDYFDEETNCFYIDGWETDDENTEGSVVAKVYTNRVEFLDYRAFNDTNVQELIALIRQENHLKQTGNGVNWIKLEKLQHYNKKLEYIKAYIREEFNYHLDSYAERKNTEEFINEINSAYQCIGALCDCAVAFKEISNQEASYCRDLFQNTFGDQINI